ncbi:MAG: 4-(cytidine 5'-diphospho)-2-C-methyl-D-erythritol kinase [Gammaproteobacteria bacterium]|nr:4-(cytidine 5'-diphospho)-2-C-methyl-D-erythritol kinase [Gammaproteobacteria bacterium]
MNDHFWPAPAKLNLMLHITGRRADGYHELQTVFQFIDFCDELKFEVRADDCIIRHCDDFNVPENEDIIIRAAQVLRERFPRNNAQKQAVTKKSVDNQVTEDFGVDIYLKKKIPMGAGLGGGSSDAATTLVALNKLWGMQFSIEELSEIGLSLGADVPVFVHGFAAFAEGVGEKLSPISLIESWYLVLIPPVNVSTKEIFSNRELTRDCSAIKLCDLSRREWRNVCTPVVIKNYPEVSQAIDVISNYSKACMSGTGASVFAVFETKAKADEILQQIRKDSTVGSWNCFVVRGLNQSPLHQYLDSLSVTDR